MRQLSIIIPTYNRLARLQRVLAGLAQQVGLLHRLQVVVVTDGSTDGTNSFLQAAVSAATFPFSLQIISQQNQGVAAARNRGIEAATGEWVLFLDDDVVPTPNLVQEHLETHRQQGPNTVVLGPMLSPPDFAMQPWVDWEQKMLLKQYDDMAAARYQPTARQFFTGNTSLERHHLVKQGGFDARFRRAEDVELAYRLERAGLRFVFNGDAIGHHYAERSFDSWLATPYAYGKNDVLFWRELGCDWLLPTLCREYQARHALIRSATALCLDRAWLSSLFQQAMQRVAAGAPTTARLAYSAIFNLRYYQGVADELGGRAAFFAQVAHYRTATATVPPSADLELPHRSQS